MSNSNVNEYSRETPLGIVQTNKVVQVYNERNTKYTFKVSDPTNASSVINLVVVDMDGDIVEYFVQYIFSENVSIPLTSTGTVDMKLFSGAMLFYDNNGVLLGSNFLEEGQLIERTGQSNPCDDNTDTDTDTDSDDTDDNNNSGSGGGAVGNEEDDTNDNDSSSGQGEYEDPDNPNPCVIGVQYGDCGCGPLGANDGHSRNPDSHCCKGSPTTFTDTCNGNSFTINNRVSNREGGLEESPCDGTVGVLVEIEEEENDCLPGFNCRSGEFLDENCECQIDLTDPCANRDLLNYQVSSEILSTLESRQQTNSAVQSSQMVDSFTLETINDGWGDVNQDKFSIKINQLPDGYTPFQLFDEIRMNFANMVVGGDMAYISDVNLEPYSDDDGVLWDSDNPEGAAMDFDTILDTSTVYCVEYNIEEMYWVFATVTSYDHQGHFVAGIRQFGLEPNGSGGYSFYVRAADRLGGIFDYALNGLSGSNEVLFTQAGDPTWKNLMNNTMSFVQNQGGDVEEFDSNKTYGTRHPFDEDDCQDEN